MLVHQKQKSAAPFDFDILRYIQLSPNQHTLFYFIIPHLYPLFSAITTGYLDEGFVNKRILPRLPHIVFIMSSNL